MVIDRGTGFGFTLSCKNQGSQRQVPIKYLGINLTKQVKDMYSENCKTFKK